MLVRVTPACITLTDSMPIFIYVEWTVVQSSIAEGFATTTNSAAVSLVKDAFSLGTLAHNNSAPLTVIAINYCGSAWCQRI